MCNVAKAWAAKDFKSQRGTQIIWFNGSPTGLTLGASKREQIGGPCPYRCIYESSPGTQSCLWAEALPRALPASPEADNIHQFPRSYKLQPPPLQLGFPPGAEGRQKD